ncbi:hypothetical protein C823_006720 [Eubacterium plexicaudatum ASF492]|uniref:Peptidase S8/S53 domain-containing protein n=1 Tax=Eubacterium plexicaudatum ASF492 TaxID=1235802 RepID=N2A4A4_9FIRM|nr:hypothetical protein C823_006720 [Eubacterium plexicaudatum ASF492]
MGKKIKVLVIGLILTMMTASTVFADTTREEHEGNGLDLLLKSGDTMEQVEQAISQISPDITLSWIPEIACIHLELPASVDKEEIISHERIRPFISAKGNLPDISAPLNPLNSIDLNNVAAVGDSRFRSQMTDEELFDAMAWHVDEITDHRMSLDIAKGDGARIALIDSGVDVEHPILKGKINMEDSCSYVSDEVGIADYHGHGTGVAGILTQVAPQAEITVYKVIGEETGESDWTIRAVIQAANDGNHIINMSLGTYKCEDVESELLTIEAFQRAIEYAQTKNCIVVASAGNKSLDLDQYYETEHKKHLPGGVEQCITVSSVMENALASYSNFGMNIDLCAPGGDLVYVDGALDLSKWIYCLYPTNKDNGLSSLDVPQGYSFSYGTSFAAPAVSAGLADILSYYIEKGQDVSMNQIMEDMMRGAEDIGAVGKDIYFGVGEVQLYQSLHTLK